MALMLIFDRVLQNNRVGEETSRLKSVRGFLQLPFCPMTPRLQASGEELSVPLSPGSLTVFQDPRVVESATR